MLPGEPDLAIIADHPASLSDFDAQKKTLITYHHLLRIK
jgi:hypothetical protein